MGQDYERWWTKSGDDLGAAVWELGTALRQDQESVETRALRSLRLYDGRDGIDLWTGSAGSILGEHDEEELDYNLSRAACDTVHAEIAGRQKPVATFQTSGADWKTKRKAKKMEKFCRSVMHQRQGQFLNSWELMESGFRDATVVSMGVVKVFPKDGRIQMERHFEYELFVDPVEARYGNPRNLFHVYQMDKDMALAAFAESDDLNTNQKKSVERAIETADEDKRGLALKSQCRAAKSITIVEAWHLPRSKGEPGKHVFATNGKLLFEEDWDRPSFPFVVMRWDTDLVGWRAKGLVEQGESIHREVTHNARKLKERFDLCGSKRTYYYEDSLDEADLESNEAEVFIRIKPGAQFPQENSPKPIADAEVMWMNECYQKYYEMTGVSQTRASARKEPGVTAGVAIRTLNDMQTARFSLKAKTYENAYVQLAEQILYCARDMAASGEEVEYDEEVDWANLDVDDPFDITIAPASSLPNDPAGRMQMAQELFSGGIIQIETFKQLLGWPDLEKEMNFQTAQSEYIEQIIDQMLDGGEYEPPDPHLIDKNSALLQMSQAYLRALYDRAPQDVLTQLSNWIVEIDQVIADGARAAAMAQAQMQQEIQGMMQPPAPMGMQPAGAPPAQTENANAA